LPVVAAAPEGPEVGAEAESAPARTRAHNQPAQGPGRLRELDSRSDRADGRAAGVRLVPGRHLLDHGLAQASEAGVHSAPRQDDAGDGDLLAEAAGARAG